MVVPSVLIEHWLVADMQTPDHEFYHALHAFFPSFLLLPVFFICQLKFISDKQRESVTFV